jgi:hypothetical protein
MDIAVRSADPRDVAALTKLAHAAKWYWHYPEEYILLWLADLTVTSSLSGAIRSIALCVMTKL